MVQKIPDFVEGKMGYYAMAAETAISPGTWEAGGPLASSREVGGRCSCCSRLVPRDSSP